MTKNKNRGKLIAFYGVNNLGRSTQAALLVKNLEEKGLTARQIKFPAYGLEPTGSLIMDYLTDEDKYDFNKREFQLLNFINLTQKQIEIEKILDKGEWIVCESYFATASAWGVGTGVNEDVMYHLYEANQREDLAIFFDGEMFERQPNEKSKLDKKIELVTEVQKIQKNMAQKYDWDLIEANKPVKEVEKDIWEIVKEIL